MPDANQGTPLYDQIVGVPDGLSIDVAVNATPLGIEEVRELERRFNRIQILSEVYSREYQRWAAEGEDPFDPKITEIADEFSEELEEWKELNLKKYPNLLALVYSLYKAKST